MAQHQPYPTHPEPALSRPRRQQVIATALVALVVLLGVGITAAVWGVRSSRPPSPDPGNHLIAQLASDPFITEPPPGATQTSFSRSPASYRGQALGDPGGWDGPAVTITFTTTQPAAEVYAYYETRATELGWTDSGRRDGLGYPNLWRKPSTGKHELDMRIDRVNSTGTPIAGNTSYTINGSAI